ncbi:MAG TPA: ABC transporter substrate-binding protein [Thermotogota bacterium]|nr:ABC transporter substrate-binding protein [Thermotogota bacterium]HPJ88983.1 ABC transporter substrate-binding protein [Thermotogota bacterium]HPR97264.1 ABC transporter substrate-binding protein [Thermotogota bacterium]
MKKFLVLLLLVLVAVSSFAAYDIAFIVKATDSDFWQYTIVGAKNAEHDLNGLINITVYGPPSEADIDQQIAILENVISSGPDAIVMSSISSDAPSALLDEAYNAGIPVVLIDNKVFNTGYTAFLATDNAKGGALAADLLIKNLQDRGIALKGKIGLISAMAGVQVLIDRDDGFKARMSEIAPSVEILPTRYIDNDISKAANATEDLLIANNDIIGFFADNNHSGDGVARVIQEQGLGESVISVAYDSDPLEVEAVEMGDLKGLIVQDPHGMGYKGVMFAYMALQGESFPSYFDTGVYVITEDDLDSAEGILDPFTRKRY